MLLSCMMLGLLISGLAGVATAAEITKAPFGKTVDGRDAEIYTLRNAKGAEAKITNYGAVIVSMSVPDRAGKMGNVILSYNSPADYFQRNPSCGAVIGRFANRIAKGKFTLNGKEYTLAKNNGENHIHGGTLGFNKVLWTAKPKKSKQGPALELTYLAKDGEEGYPGNLKVKAVYTLTDANELRLDMTATTDKDTVVNLTNHAYFNLIGPGQGDVRDYEVTLNASKFLPVRPDKIPTGELRPVAGTAFDFTKPATVRQKSDPNDEQLKIAQGYDHCFVVDKPAGQLGLAARVDAPANGRVMEVLTTQPGVQFFSCGSLRLRNTNAAPPNAAPRPNAMRPRSGAGNFALEPQHFPNSPNQPEFPSTVLKTGETLKETIVFRFSVKK
jgi:aldose 1-epimerase